MKSLKGLYWFHHYGRLYCYQRCLSTSEHAYTASPLTMQKVKLKLQQIVRPHKPWSQVPNDYSDEQKNLPNIRQDLPVKLMGDSYQEAIISLSTDKQIQEKYLNVFKMIRFGRILEDLDTFAAFLGYCHCRDVSKGPDQVSPLSIVTAMVDKIEFHNYVDPSKDIRISGNVTWVGRSSMEMTMKLQQDVENCRKTLLKALFVMVARDSLNRAEVVNSLKPTTKEEEMIFQQGKENKVRRQQVIDQSLLRNPPNEEEQHIIHKLFLDSIDQNAKSFRIREKPENTVWMRSTVLKNLIICHPEERNIHNKIFGGFLMRQAFELGWANASLYSKTRPRTECVEDIHFQKPVEIGSLLLFLSQVVYVKESKMQVRVQAYVVNPVDGSEDTTNTFHFTFDSQKGNLPRVLPKSYGETMLYLDGKRIFESKRKTACPSDQNTLGYPKGMPAVQNL